MKISITRDSSVPIRDQLVEQIGLQIASGALRGEEKLPSVRALAQRLGIHYNTVGSAYNHLSEIGLLEIRQGSGVRVASKVRHREMELRVGGIDALLRDFLALAAENGFSRRDLEDSVSRVLSRAPVKRILLVDRNPDFHKLIVAELAPHFDLPVEARTVDELTDLPAPIDEALIVTSLYHLFAIADAGLDPTRLVVCNVEPGRAEQDAVAALPKGSLLLIVSVSPTLLKMATNVMAALRGDEIAVRTVLAEDRQEVEYTAGFANLIICDGPSHQEVKRLAGKVPVQAFRLYSDATVALIRDRLAKWG